MQIRSNLISKWARIHNKIRKSIKLSKTFHIRAVNKGKNGKRRASNFNIHEKKRPTNMKAKRKSRKHHNFLREKLDFLAKKIENKGRNGKR